MVFISAVRPSSSPTAAAPARTPVVNNPIKSIKVVKYGKKGGNWPTTLIDGESATIYFSDNRVSFECNTADTTVYKKMLIMRVVAG